MPFISFPAENRAPGRKKGAEQVRLDAGKGREGVREEPWAGWGAWVSAEWPGDSKRQGGLRAHPGAASDCSLGPRCPVSPNSQEVDKDRPFQITNGNRKSSVGASEIITSFCHMFFSFLTLCFLNKYRLSLFPGDTHRQERKKRHKLQGRERQAEIKALLGNPQRAWPTHTVDKRGLAALGDVPSNSPWGRQWKPPFFLALTVTPNRCFVFVYSVKKSNEGALQK